MWIRPGDISQLTVSGLDPVTFTGKAVKTEFAIQNETYTLEEGTDYTVEYSSNLHAGTGRIKVTGIEPYSGRGSLHSRFFRWIWERPMKPEMLNIDYTSLYHGPGEAINVEPYAVAVNGTFLLKGRGLPSGIYRCQRNYDSICQRCRQLQMILEGINDYTGTIELPVKVTKRHGIV